MTQENINSLLPGEALVLLSPLQELEPGIYLLKSIVEGWAELRWVIDDQVADRVIVTERQYRVPLPMLELFMPIGLRLAYSA